MTVPITTAIPELETEHSRSGVQSSSPARSAREQFDAQAAHYDRQWNQWSEESLAWLRDHADARPTDRLLDVATGTGFTALAFAPLVASVVGLDVSPGMLAQAREQAERAQLGNVTFQEGAAEALPFPNSSFDIVTCRVAPHHFLSVPQFVGEVARVLVPGGRFLLADTSVPDNAPEVADWQNRVEMLRDPSHVRNYTPSEWRTFLENAGLRVQPLEHAGTIPITLEDWLTKAGCVGETAEQVRDVFRTAPSDCVAAFQIASRPDGDIGFVWQRVVCPCRQSLHDHIKTLKKFSIWC